MKFSVTSIALFLLGNVNASRSHHAASFEQALNRFASRLVKEANIAIQKAAEVKAAEEEQARKTFIVNIDHEESSGPIALKASDDYDVTVIRRTYSQRRGLANYYCMDVTATETRRLVDDIGLVRQSTWDDAAPVWLTIEDDRVEIQSHRVYFRPNEKVTTVTSCVGGETPPEDPTAYQFTIAEKCMIALILVMAFLWFLIEVFRFDLLDYLFDMVRRPNVRPNVQQQQHDDDEIWEVPAHEAHLYPRQPYYHRPAYPTVSLAELAFMLRAEGADNPVEID